VAAEVEEKSDIQRDNDVDVGVQGHDLHSDPPCLAIQPLRRPGRREAMKGRLFALFVNSKVDA
jgi:hypothetical protein